MEGKVAVSRQLLALVLVVLATAPFVLGFLSLTSSSPANGTHLSNNTPIVVSYTGTANITIEYNTTGSYTTYNQTNLSLNTISYNINTGEYSTGVYNFKFTITNSTNSTDNLTVHFTGLTIDHDPPKAISVVTSPNNPSSTSTSVTATINVSDASNITNVYFTANDASFTFSSGQNYSSAIFIASFTPDTYGCVNDAQCYINVTFNDSYDNSNHTVQLNLNDSFFVDASAPSVLNEVINMSLANMTQNITIGAEWDEIALIDEEEYAVTFFRRINGVWTSSINQLVEWNNSNLDRNWTNTTYWVNGSDEGQTLTFKINLTDSQSRTTSTNNLVATVSNVSPNIRVITPPNGSLFASTTPIELNITDIGVGINLSLFNITAHFYGAQNPVTITRSANSSLFSCSQDYRDEKTQVYLCDISSSWLSGDFHLDFNISDIVRNTNTTSFNGTIVQTPEIRNLTINNQNYTIDVNADSVELSITNSSRELNFTWNVSKNSPLNHTGIRVHNETPSFNYSTPDLPVARLINITAGRTYLIINATLNDSVLTDEVQINLTANVPLNLSWIQAVHNASTLIDNWEVHEDGTDIAVSTTEQFVNGTYNIILSGTNQSNVVPYEFTFNHSSVPGLTVRWNATNDAWDVSQVSTAELAELNTLSRANVTIALKNNGQNDIFFDGNRYLVSAEFNISMGNRSVFYRMKNSSGDSTYLLSACASTPTSAITANQSCYESSGSNTTLYIPRFAEEDMVFFGQAPFLAPNITINVPELVSQSHIYVDFTVITPIPNTTFCEYNVSFFNRTLGNSTHYAFNELTTANATFSGNIYSFNLSAGPYAPDSEYNLTITCEDTNGTTNTTRFNFTVVDTTAPKTSSRSATTTTNSGTVSVTADENTTLTINYGESEDSPLSSSETDSSTRYDGEVTILDLSSDNFYFYNITLCDIAGNCNETGTFFFQTDDTPTGNGGGGGGGGGGASSDGLEATDFRYWSALRDQQWMSYIPKNMVFTSISLFFSTAVDQAQLTIQQYATKPPGASEAPTIVYKYFVANHRGLETVTQYEVSFKVPKEWYEEKGVAVSDTHILRFEDDSWVGYLATPVSNDESFHYFDANIPGFSFLAIGGKPGQISVVDPSEDELGDGYNDTNDSITTPGPSDEQVMDPNKEQPTPFVSALDESGFKMPFWVWILVAIIVLAGAGVGGFQLYQLQKMKEEEHKQELEKAKIEYQIQRKAQQGDSIAQLQDYIIRMKGKNIPDEEIKRRLHAVGWDTIAVEQELDKLKGS